MFDLKTNLFMKYIEFPEEDYIKGIIKTLTGFEIEYLNDDIYMTLIEDFKEIKNKVSNFKVNNKDNSVKIDISIDNEKRTMSLEKVELSDMGELLKKKNH